MFLTRPGAGVDDVYWIGATDAVQEGEFRWSDGLPFSYARKFNLVSLYFFFFLVLCHEAEWITLDNYESRLVCSKISDSDTTDHGNTSKVI